MCARAHVCSENGSLGPVSVCLIQRSIDDGDTKRRSKPKSIMLQTMGSRLHGIWAIGSILTHLWFDQTIDSLPSH